MTDFKVGDRVRFTKGPLGLMKLDDPYHFVERTVKTGDEGTISEWQSNIDGWYYVAVDDGLYCPVHPYLIEHAS